MRFSEKAIFLFEITQEPATKNGKRIIDLTVESDDEDAEVVVIDEPHAEIMTEEDDMAASILDEIRTGKRRLTRKEINFLRKRRCSGTIS